MNKKIILLVLILIALPGVFAQLPWENLGCCLEMDNGATCQSVPLLFGECATSIIPTHCSLVPDCNLGCCIDDVEGICSSQTMQESCESEGGRWDNDARCEIDYCQEGCCTLGSRNIWTTERACEKATIEQGYLFNFDKGIISERECYSKGKTQEVGACVIETGRICKFGTATECSEIRGDFYEGYLCSNPELETVCEKQISIGCVEGKDEIYWLDSCGNKENIYDSDRTKSWNRGYVLPKEESCRPSLDNIESTNCGNCNYELGSICSKSSDAEGKKVKDGNYVCRSLNCIDYNGRERINGETWCDYDGTVGLGRDLIGSRHWVMSCVDGEIKSEGCADLRHEVCTEEKIFDPDTKELISSAGASCKPNEWEACLAITEKYIGIQKSAISSRQEVEDDLTECITNPQCYVGVTKDLALVGDAIPLVCLPNYPPANSDKCSLMGTVQCDGECPNDWVEQMNDLCTSLGDCGIWPNVEGTIPRPLWLVSNPFPSTAYMIAISRHANPEGIIGTAIDVITKSSDLLLLGELEPEYWKYLAMEGAEDRVVFGPGGGREKTGALGVAGNVMQEVQCQIMEYVFKVDLCSAVTYYSCREWDPPVVKRECEKCNDDPLKPCTEYRCNSLGRNCEILEETKNTDNPVCRTTRDDGKEPEITIDSSEEECVKEYTFSEIIFSTDEFAQCRYDLEEVAYEEMKGILVEEFGYTKEHTIEFTIPNLNSLEEADVSGDLIERLGDLKVYVRCKDTHGNINSEPEIVEICVESGPDIYEPYIVKTEPESESYVAFDSSEKEVTIYVNEPVECKYDLSPEIEYENMLFDFICENGLEDVEDFGWPCSATLENIFEQEKKFYIKCEDQPWLGEDVKRNANLEDYEYVLYSSEAELKIDYISAEHGDQLVMDSGTIKDSISPVSIDLEVSTSGGMDSSGTAICYYGFIANSNLRFSVTNSNTHYHTFTEVNEGEHVIFIECEDEAGNIASGQLNLTIDIDKNAPSITRAYQENGYLNIITNEQAECYYDLTSCSFDLEEGISMTTGLDVEHNTPWNIEQTYYIKCRDAWENINSDCAIIVKPSSFEE